MATCEWPCREKDRTMAEQKKKSGGNRKKGRWGRKPSNARYAARRRTKESRREKTRARRKEALAKRREIHRHQVIKLGDSYYGWLVRKINEGAGRVTKGHKTRGKAYKALREAGVPAKMIIG